MLAPIFEVSSSAVTAGASSRTSRIMAKPGMSESFARMSFMWKLYSRIMMMPVNVTQRLTIPRHPHANS